MEEHWPTILVVIVVLALVVAAILRRRAPSRPAVSAPDSRKTLRVINLLTLVGGAWLLLLGFWPGLALGDGICLLLSLPAIPLLGLAWMVVCLRRAPKPWGRAEASLRLRQIAIAPIVVGLTLMLLIASVPLRVGLVIVQSRLERHVATAADRPASLGVVFPYHVDAYASDPRGGIYFRTGTTLDAVDTISHGFVHRPNRVGTPFGRARYALNSLWGDWYTFSVSDDY